MANYYNSPNMNLVIPVPTLAPGPEWAQEINASLTTIDGHDHSAGNGVLINPTGMTINQDLSFQTNNATVVRSVRFNPNASPITASSPDLGAIYRAGVDLYYNDGNGNQIRITQSGSVAGSAGTITGLPFGTASAAYVSGQGTFVFQQSTSTAANLDVGTMLIRYPGSYPTPSGNYIALEAPASLASGYALTLPALPAQTNVMTLGTTGIISSTTWDQVGVNMTATGANAIGVSMTSTGATAIATTMGTTGANTIGNSMGSSGANAIATTMGSTGANTISANRTRSTGVTVGAGGIAISNSSGTFSTASTSPVVITNSLVNLTTSGRPVSVGLIAEAGAPSSSLHIIGASTNVTLIVQIKRFTPPSGYVTLASYSINSQTNLYCVLPPPVIDVVGAGTYEYTGWAYVSGTSPTGEVLYTKLCAYEL